MNRQFDYDTSQYPPQPVLEVVFASPESGRATPSLIAIVDSGADVSFVPIKDLKPLAVPMGETRRARSLWGERQEFKTFIVEVRIGDMILPGIEVMGYSGDEIVLGRDVLNKLWLGLDGPQRRLEVAEKNPIRYKTK
jgi:hypothetical protein